MTNGFFQQNSNYLESQFPLRRKKWLIAKPTNGIIVMQIAKVKHLAEKSTYERRGRKKIFRPVNPTKLAEKRIVCV